jgi:NTP pyrophosphatase (non-canonical NTP hydrolase)
MMTIDELIGIVVTFRDARDWKQFHTPKNLAQAMASEVGELNDLYLWDRTPNMGNVMDEVADITIYLLSLADITGIDIAECVIQKLKKNDHKYPTGKVQGDARKYTEI